MFLVTGPARGAAPGGRYVVETGVQKNGPRLAGRC